MEPDPEYDEDSEYDPTKDDDIVIESDDSDNDDKKKGPVSVYDIANEAKRKRLVDSAWADMLSNDSNEIAKKKSSLTYINNSNNINKQVKKDPTKSKKRKLSKDINDMMTTIFGSKKAKKLDINDYDDRDNRKSDEIKKNLKDIVKKIQKKEVVQETRKFAGQEIAIERTLKVGESTSSSSSSSSQVSAPVTALDKALDVLKGPKIVSTVAKSSYDWENFKEKEGIEDDLAVATKEGYLTRKDFLERCDYRSFELEREERLRNMTANSNQ